MDKLDLKRVLKPLYTANAGQPVILDVPKLPFLMIDGKGDPGAEAYGDAVGALYALAYGLKFTSKLQLGRDFAVMPLEGLWWSEDLAAFSANRRDDWLWTMMILMPDWITAALLDAVRADTARRKALLRLDDVRLESFAEGRCAQVLHLGPYAAEGPTIADLHGFIARSGHALRGKHHEIYLGMPGRGAPERLKTIIRQPIQA